MSPDYNQVMKNWRRNEITMKRRAVEERWRTREETKNCAVLICFHKRKIKDFWVKKMDAGWANPTDQNPY